MTTVPDFETILSEAHDAARAAVIAKGPENMNAFDCGFAWVTLHPATHPLARHCRASLKRIREKDAGHGTLSQMAGRIYGDKGYPNGWQWWEPGDFRGQAIGHHLAGAHAFRDVLLRYGINAEVGSRYD